MGGKRYSGVRAAQFGNHFGSTVRTFPPESTRQDNAMTNQLMWRNSHPKLVSPALVLLIASYLAAVSPTAAAPNDGMRTVHFPPANADLPRLLAERQRQQI